MVSRILEKDLEQIEKESLELGNWISHPLHSCVKIYGKDYMCDKHSKIGPLHRGTMRQHIEGREHKLDFFTGEPLEKTKKLPPLEIPQKKKTLLEDNLIQETTTEDHSKKVLSSKSKSSEKIDSSTMWFRALRRPSRSDDWDREKQGSQKIDEFDQKIEDWIKLKKMKAQNMPKIITDEFAFKKGLYYSKENLDQNNDFRKNLALLPAIAATKNTDLVKLFIESMVCEQSPELYVTLKTMENQGETGPNLKEMFLEAYLNSLESKPKELEPEQTNNN